VHSQEAPPLAGLLWGGHPYDIGNLVGLLGRVALRREGEAVEAVLHINDNTKMLSTSSGLFCDSGNSKVENKTELCAEIIGCMRFGVWAGFWPWPYSILPPVNSLFPLFSTQASIHAFIGNNGKIGMAPLANWIWSGLSEGQPIDPEEAVQDTS